MEKYDIKIVSLLDKYYIYIFEVLLTIRYIHSQKKKKKACRVLTFINIIINQNKDVILIDFDRLIKENLNKEGVIPEENKTYKSDIYSLDQT